MIEKLKKINEKLKNKKYSTIEEVEKDVLLINFNIEDINTIEELEEVEQLLLQTKIKYFFDIASNFYYLVIEKIKELNANEYLKEKEKEKQKELLKDKEKYNNFYNIILEKLNNLKQSEKIKDGNATIRTNPYLKYKNFKIFKNNDNKITIKEKNKNIFKNITINKAVKFLIDNI